MIYVIKMCSYDICAHISVNISFQSASQPDVSCNSGCTFPCLLYRRQRFHPFAGVINNSTKGTRPRIWKESAVSRGHGSCHTEGIGGLRPPHFSSSSVAGSKKKVGKVHDVKLKCSLAVSWGCLLWVSLALPGYANILTLSYSYTMFYCA